MKTFLSISAAILVLWGLATLAGIGNRQGNSATSESGIYHIAVTQIGFTPAEITIPKGRPVTLVVTRLTDEISAKDIAFPTLHQRYELPLGEPVEIHLAPQPVGSLSYACGNRIYGGKITIR
jgi:plastocyanin domain-containing protein